jgi:putative transposase
VLAKAVNGLYEAEVIHRDGSWCSMGQLGLATAEWVDCWNNRRLHRGFGGVPPAEYQALYHRNGEAAPAG